MKKLMTILLLLCLFAVLCSCSVGMYDYDHSSRYTAGGTTVTGRVQALDVSWIDGSVIIGVHDGDGVILRERCSRSLWEAAELHWWLDGDTLYVKYAEAGFRTAGSLDKELTVLLPADMPLDKLKVGVVSGNVETADVTADALEVSTVSGKVAAERMLAADVQVNSVSGGVTLCFDRVPDKLEVSTVSGNARILLPDASGYTARVSTVSGGVSGNLPMERDGMEYSCGSGRSRISVNTVSGSVQLDAAR